MHGKEQIGSGSCVTPERKRNEMLIFSCLLTWTHAQTWLQNTGRLKSQKKLWQFSFTRAWSYSSSHSSASVSSFFLAIFSGLFWLSGPFLLLLFLLLPLHPFLPAPSLHSCKQIHSPSLLPRHCYSLIQTTVNFSTQIGQIPDLFYVWLLFGAVAPIVSAASKQKAI